MVDSGNGADDLHRRVAAHEGGTELESALRLGVESVRETQLDHTQRLGDLDVRLEGLDAKVSNLEDRVDELDLKVELVAEDVGAVRESVERILELMTA